MKKNLIKIGLFAIVLVLSLPFTAKAVDIGIQISPLTYNYDIQPGESKEIEIEVTNLNLTPLNYVVEIENFNQVTDDGAPSFTTKNPDSSITTLKDWIVPSVSADKEGVINSKLSKTIKFTISVPVGAEPGGHYAAVFAKEVKKNSEGKTELGLASRVGTLILVSVPGAVDKSVEISDFDAPSVVWKGPNDISMKVKNTGTVHYDSEGKIKIKSMFGGESILDLGKHTVIPDNQRNYLGTWSSKYPFGRYVLEATATDGDGNAVSAEKILWALPLIIIIPVIVALIILIWIIIYLKRHVKIV